MLTLIGIAGIGWSIIFVRMAYLNYMWDMYWLESNIYFELMSAVTITEVNWELIII